MDFPVRQAPLLVLLPSLQSPKQPTFQFNPKGKAGVHILSSRVKHKLKCWSTRKYFRFFLIVTRHG